MSKEMSLILLGIFVAVLPHLGFPSEIKVIAFAICGLLIALIGFLLRGETLSRGTTGSESRPTRRRSKIVVEPQEAEDPTLE
jgi:hypothetical protein